MNERRRAACLLVLALGAPVLAAGAVDPAPRRAVARHAAQIESVTPPTPSPTPTAPPASAPLAERADIALASIGTDGMTVDPETLAVSGSLAITLTNRATVPLTRTEASRSVTIAITAFVDADGDRRLSPPGDHVLALATWPEGGGAEARLAPGASVAVDVPLPPGATLPFRDAPIAIAFALENAEDLDPSDNVQDTAGRCLLPPVRGAGPPVPVEKWHWPAPGATITEPTSTRVSHAPLVADLDGDGWPEVIFVSRTSGSTGILRAIDGRDGREVFSVPPSPETDLHTITMPAVGDVDGDGRPEIVAVGPGDTVRDLLVFGHDGRLEGRIEAMVTVQPFETGENGPYLADVDADGVPEIVAGRDIRRADGTPVDPAAPTVLGAGGIVATDLQLDGRLDLVSGPFAHALVGGALARTWTAQNPLDLETSTSRVAIASFPDLLELPARPLIAGEFARAPSLVHTGAARDATARAASGSSAPATGAGAPSAVVSDAFAFVVHVLAGGHVNLIDAAGSAVAGWTFPGGVPSTRQGGPPLVADFDGDGQAEVAVAGEEHLAVFDRVGGRAVSVLSERTEDPSFGRLGATAHDFDGDGAFEIVYAGERVMRMFAYSEGARALQTLWSTSRPSETNQEYPVIADVDADGRAEIVAASDFGRGGVSVYGHPEWTGARRIWNQYDYHVDNVLEDGSIPARMRSGWREHGTFRASVPERGSRSAPDLSVSRAGLSGPDPDGVYRLTVRIGNGGGLTVGPSVPLALEIDGTRPAAPPPDVERALPPGASADVTLPFTVSAGVDPAAAQLTVIVNPEAVAGASVGDLAPDVPHRECRYDNNTWTSRLGDVAAPATPTAATSPSSTAPSSPALTPTPTDTPSGTPAGPSPPPPARTPIARYLPVALSNACAAWPAARDLAVVIDLSIGMRDRLGAPSELAAAVGAAAAGARAGDRWAGVAFAGRVLATTGRLGDAGELADWIESLAGLAVPEPGTAIHAGFGEAARVLRDGAVPGRAPIVILISDGLEDRTSARDSERTADALRADGIGIAAIAFGPYANLRALARLAGDGGTVRAVEGTAGIGPGLIGILDALRCARASPSP